MTRGIRLSLLWRYLCALKLIFYPNHGQWKNVTSSDFQPACSSELVLNVCLERVVPGSSTATHDNFRLNLILPLVGSSIFDQPFPWPQQELTSLAGLGANWSPLGQHLQAIRGSHPGQNRITGLYLWNSCGCRHPIAGVIHSVLAPV